MKRPSLVIDSTPRSLPSQMRDLLECRELLHFLALRDLKVRYRQTILGGLWALLQPFLYMVVFSLFFGALAGVPSDGLPYPIFVFAALLPWQFFSNGINAAGNSLVSNSHLISKVYFPRVLIPLSTLEVVLVDFLVAFALLVIMMLYYGIAPGAGFFALPLILAAITAATLGTGLILAAMNASYRDFRYVIPFLTQFWFFVTPVIYPSSLVPDPWRWLLNLNPMAGLITNFRAGVLGQPLQWPDMAVSAAAALMLLVAGISFFWRVERKFADVI
jgi:lipopolysaccharide transport system permease protein